MFHGPYVQFRNSPFSVHSFHSDLEPTWTIWSQLKHVSPRNAPFKTENEGKVVPALNQLRITPWRRKGEWRYSSTILYLGSRWRWVVIFMPQTLYPQGECPGIHCIGGRVGPTAGLNEERKKTIVFADNRTPDSSVAEPVACRYTDLTISKAVSIECLHKLKHKNKVVLFSITSWNSGESTYSSTHSSFQHSRLGSFTHEERAADAKCTGSRRTSSWFTPTSRLGEEAEYAFILAVNNDLH
jgi:hypothetical protein